MESGDEKRNQELETTEILNEKEDVNILIVGETGVGKSTWINAIANYAKYNSPQDAMDAPELTVLIPSRFVFIDETGEEREIAFGSDSNEVLQDGQSATQFCQEYTIETETTKYRVIDTPGIGDCRGIEQDKENFDNILSFLSSYEKIDAVVVLLKPNNNGLSAAFKFCVKELLTQLHKSLMDNIIFAFTNCRATFFRPGNTLPVLKNFLKEEEINITVSPSTYFCFDNEAFRFLACQKKGVQFTDKEVGFFLESWESSREATGKIFNLVKSKPPHEIKKTLSLSEARSYIAAISKPMGEAVELIELNLKKVSNMKDLFKEVDESNKELKQKLTFKGFERKVNLLNYSITVCADPNCKKYEYIGETRKRVPTYPQICDEPCKLKGVTFEATNRHQLYRCKVMRDGKCSKCNHDYRVHMHLNYTTTLVEKEFLPKDAQDKITEMDNHKAQREAFIAELEKRIMELEDEKKYIFECASQYGVFLKQNALIVHNDSFSDYLDMLIKEEEAKETMIRDDKRIAELKENKQAYEQQKEQIMRKVQGSSDSNKEVIYLEKIYEIKAKLCSLKHSGETLKETLEDSMSAIKKTREEESKKNYQQVTSTAFLGSIGSLIPRLSPSPPGAKEAVSKFK